MLGVSSAGRPVFLLRLGVEQRHYETKESTKNSGQISERDQGKGESSSGNHAPIPKPDQISGGETNCVCTQKPFVIFHPEIRKDQKSFCYVQL